MKRAVGTILACVMIETTVSSLAAETVEMTVFGHKVAVVGPFNEQKLMVDGRKLVEDAIISIDSIDEVGGMKVLVGGSGNGGNTCNSSPFIVSLVKGKPAKIYGPVDDCATFQVDVGAEAISIVAPAFPYKPGHRYNWTPSDGLKDEGKIAFKPDGQSDWSTLGPQKVELPLDLYKNREVNAAIQSFTGSDDRIFAENLDGISSGKFIGDVYVGSGCRKGECRSTGSFIAADRTNRKVYLAWKEEGKPFVVRPPVGNWPGQIRHQLKDWTKEFD